MLVLTDRANYEAIADALRRHSHSDAEYLPSEMAAAILALCTSGRPVVVPTGYEMRGNDYESACTQDGITGITLATTQLTVSPMRFDASVTRG